MMKEHDTALIQMLTYPPGPIRVLRKQALRPTLAKGDVNDETLGAIWHDHIEVNNYDAKDTVEEWWHEWGRLM
jgi:salicylate hydroxylase